MRNFNVDYDPTKVYSNSKNSKAENKEIIWSMPILLIIIDTISAYNSARTTMNHIDSDFLSLYLLCLANK